MCSIKEEKQEKYSSFNMNCDTFNMKCDVCEKVYSSKGTLKRHKNTIHSSVRFPCHLCIKSFSQKHYVKRHIERIHGVKAKDTSNYPFECEMCGKKYTSVGGLSYHIDSQHNEDVHYCSVCIRRFSTNQVLQEHMKINHDNLLYEQRLLKGKRLLEFMVEEQVPVDIIPPEDMKLINLYRRYVYQKVNTWSDYLVPL